MSMETRVSAESGTGLPAFSYYMPYWPRFWTQVKRLLSSGTPILMRLYPGKAYPMSEDELHGVVDREGHVIMITGYDDKSQEVIYVDPWDREKWGGSSSGLSRMAYRTAVLCWVDSTLDFMDAPVPWDVVVALIPLLSRDPIATHEILASVFYTCPEPFDVTKFVASPVTVRLSLPEGLVLAAGASPEVVVQSLAPGESAECVWRVAQVAPVHGEIVVHAKGAIHGDQPYEYADTVGIRGEITVELPLEADVRASVVSGSA